MVSSTTPELSAKKLSDKSAFKPQFFDLICQGNSRIWDIRSHQNHVRAVLQRCAIKPDYQSVFDKILFLFDKFAEKPCLQCKPVL
jgi:hypothetical protein